MLAHRNRRPAQTRRDWCADAGRGVGQRQARGRRRRALARSVMPFILVALLPTPSGTQAPAVHPSPTSTDSANLIKVGYLRDLLPDVDSRDARVAIELWLMQAAAELDLNVSAKVQFYEDMSSMVDALAEGRVDVVTLPPLDYLEVRKRVELEVFTVGVMQGRVTDEHLILVRSDGGFAALDQLKGATLIAESGRYARPIASMWLETLLLKEELGHPESFFGTIKYARKAPQAVLGVLFRKYDACLVTRRAFETLAELNPQLGEELTVLRRSPGFLREILCGRRGQDVVQKEALLEGALRLQDHPRGRQVLELFRMENVVRFDPAYLETVIGLVKEHEGLKNRP